MIKERILPYTIVGIIGLAFYWSIASIVSSEAKVIAERKEATQQTEAVMVQVVGTLNDMLFVKDETTGLCFAHLSKRSQFGGIALTHIPCDSTTNMISFWSNN